MSTTPLAPQNSQIKLNQFLGLVHDSKRIVFFGGAGVSTASGIPDFRSANGLYSKTYDSDISPEKIVSSWCLYEEPELFFSFYKQKLDFSTAQPNVIHHALAKLEDQGKLSAIVTQNIDGLHQAAGSKKVLELHGSLRDNYCIKCRETYTASQLIKAIEYQAPKCTPLCDCGGTIRPNVTLFGELLNGDVVDNAIKEISIADLIIIGGTSLKVYPAAYYIHYRNKSSRLVIVNRDTTDQDSNADIVLNMSLEEAFGSL